MGDLGSDHKESPERDGLQPGEAESPPDGHPEPLSGPELKRSELLSDLEDAVYQMGFMASAISGAGTQDLLSELDFHGAFLIMSNIEEELWRIMNGLYKLGGLPPSTAREDARFRSGDRFRRDFMFWQGGRSSRQ